MNVKGKNDVAMVYFMVFVLLNSAEYFDEVEEKFQPPNETRT